MQRSNFKIIDTLHNEFQQGNTQAIEHQAISLMISDKVSYPGPGPSTPRDTFSFTASSARSYAKTEGRKVETPAKKKELIESAGQLIGSQKL